MTLPSTLASLVDNLARLGEKMSNAPIRAIRRVAKRIKGKSGETPS